MFHISSSNELSNFLKAGTSKDVSFLIDLLPAYLFPNDERTITTWGMLGVSLGGHATWITLKSG